MAQKIVKKFVIVASAGKGCTNSNMLTKFVVQKLSDNLTDEQFEEMAPANQLIAVSSSQPVPRHGH